MIGAVEGSASYSQPATRAGITPPVVRASTSACAGSPELAEQVRELIQSYGESTEAILRAQASVFKEALDIGKGMASGVLQMLKGVEAFQAAQVQPHGATGVRIHVVA